MPPRPYSVVYSSSALTLFNIFISAKAFLCGKFAGKKFVTNKEATSLDTCQNNSSKKGNGNFGSVFAFCLEHFRVFECECWKMEFGERRLLFVQ